MSTSTPVTEAHIALSARITRENGYDPESAWNRPHVLRDAQLIAESEAKAVAELRAEVERLKAQRDNLLKPMRDEAIARAERAEEIADRWGKRAISLEAELATERARMDWLLSKMGGLVLPANRCVAWTVAFYDYENRFPSRSAIDRALGGGPK